MRALCIGVVCAGTLFTSSYAMAGAHYMTETKRIVDLSSVTPEPGSAALVVARTTSMGRLVTFDTYLDREMIGATRGKGYFIKTDVAPGTHFVISKAENWETVKIAFEPGRVYYILEVVRVGMWKARLSKQLLTPEQLKDTLDDGCKLLVYDGSGPRLEDKDYATAVRDYEREVKEGEHDEHAGYRGVPAPPQAASSGQGEQSPAPLTQTAPLPQAAPTAQSAEAPAATGAAATPGAPIAPRATAERVMPQPGMTYQQVEQALGRPDWHASYRQFTRWEYKGFAVLFESDRVARIMPQGEDARPRQ